MELRAIRRKVHRQQSGKQEHRFPQLADPQQQEEHIDAQVNGKDQLHAQQAKVQASV